MIHFPVMRLMAYLSGLLRVLFVKSLNFSYISLLISLIFWSNNVSIFALNLSDFFLFLKGKKELPTFPFLGFHSSDYLLLKASWLFHCCPFPFSKRKSGTRKNTLNTGTRRNQYPCTRNPSVSWVLFSCLVVFFYLLPKDLAVVKATARQDTWWLPCLSSLSQSSRDLAWSIFLLYLFIFYTSRSLLLLARGSFSSRKS